MNIVFEKVLKTNKIIIDICLLRGDNVYIIEPFYVFHHQTGPTFYPPAFPEFIHEYIQQKKIKFIKGEDLRVFDIHRISADRAVRITSKVYPAYKAEHYEFIENFKNLVNAKDGDALFKRKLSHRISEFYSFNILLERLKGFFASEDFVLYPDVNIWDYSYVKKIINNSAQDCFNHKQIKFPFSVYFLGFLTQLKQILFYFTKLFIQAFLSAVFSFLPFSKKEKQKKEYQYGMAVSNFRQFFANQRNPDFIVDNIKIKEQEVVYLPFFQLNADQKKSLETFKGSVFYVPRPGKIFNNFFKWLQFFVSACFSKFWIIREEINCVSIELFYYFSFYEVFKSISFRHYITHCDYGYGYYGRLLALREKGVKTWYYTDSMNSSKNLENIDSGFYGLHPYWSYLHYDNFVTWNDFISEYCARHPKNFLKTHVVGCLWSSHITKRTELLMKDLLGSKFQENMFYISVFDSSYTINNLTSYKEGIRFAEHIKAIVEDFPNISILFKEKKPKYVHHKLDPVLGPVLMERYLELEKHPRITFFANSEDSTKLLSAADLVISFPFTSTTFEAISGNIPAIWHDPLGLYKKTRYAQIKRVMTHNYDDLKKHVDIIMRNVEVPCVEKSPLLDPYRDKKAIERFRDLLIEA